MPLESIYKLSDRTGDRHFTKFYRFKNIKLLDEKGKEKKLPAMENLGLSPFPTAPSGSSRNIKTTTSPTSAAQKQNMCPSATAWKSTSARTRTLPCNAGSRTRRSATSSPGSTNGGSIMISCLYYDLVDYDETFFYEEELVSGKPAKIEVERQFDANVVLWGEVKNPKAGRATKPVRMSICILPAASNGSISSTSSIFWT